jgi:acyl carrier protein
MEVKAREKLLGILEESGLYVERKSPEQDIDLREYIADSVQFMSFVVEIEAQLSIEIPDEVLVYDNLGSLNGFASILESIMDGTYMPRSSGNGNET